MAKRGRPKLDRLHKIIEDALTTFEVKQELTRKEKATGQKVLIETAQRTIAGKLSIARKLIVKPRNVRESYQKSEKLRKAVRPEKYWKPEGEPIRPNETHEQWQARLKRELARERQSKNAK